MAYDLKPFAINLNDLLYLLQQVNFVPLFDGPADSNGIVNFDPATMDAWDAKGNQVWFSATGTGSYQGVPLDGTNVGLLGQGFPHVSSPIGLRDPSGLHNNLFGDQAFWGAVDVPFRRDIQADFDNYVTSPGADYGTGNDVIDLMPRIISRTITTGGVNLLTDGPNGTGHFVAWDHVLYESSTPQGLAYKALIDASGVDTSQRPDGTYVTLVDGAKIVAPLTTEIAVLDGAGDPLVWHLAQYQASVVYTTTLGVLAASSYGGLKDATGGTLEDGEAIFYRPIPGGALVDTGQTYQPDVLAYKQLIDANVDFASGAPAEGTAIVTTISESGYGLLEQLGHIDFQIPDSGEFFIGSENPGVAPVNSWFGIFGQFFDHGLDLIGKGGNGTITINLDPSDPLYGAPGPDGNPVFAIKVARATIDSIDANGPDYVNHTSPFIDQSQTYGSVDQITNLLRKWVSTDGLPVGDANKTYHAGMELFDGQSLQDTWTRRWPDGTSTEVNDTLPTLSELRDHVLDTGRDALTWEDVANYRERDLATGKLLDIDPAAGLQTQGSGHALILDMNTRFDSAHLASTAAVGSTTVAALVTGAVATLSGVLGASIEGLSGYVGLNPGRSTAGDTFTQAPDGTIHLHLGSDLVVATGPTTSMTLHALDGTGAPIDYSGASALLPWVDFSSFNIMSPPPTIINAPAVTDAVGQILMASVGDHYIAGDGRVNENFGLTSIHHVFHEEHNYQVENLKTWIYAHDLNNPGTTDAHEQLHNWQVDTGVTDGAGNFIYENAPGTGDDVIAWDADKMFNATKLIVEMEYQHAAVDQYARTVTPRIQEFVGYSTGVDPTISLEYAQVAFRFGHSTIRETIDAVDPSGWMLGAVTRYALEKAFLNPQQYAETGVAAITLGLSRQQMNEVDEFVTPALNQGLLGQPLDLPAINLARGRDLGIPTLNDFREGISLARYTSWDDFGKNMIHPESLVNFIAAYSFGGDVSQAQAIMGLFDGTIAEGDPAALGFTAAQAVAFMLNNTIGGDPVLDAARDGFNHIDSWIGGLAEAHVPGGLLGETFDAVFVAQIQSLMDGDRFYYLYRLFGTQIHEEVNNGQFKDIVERNTGLSHLNGSIFAYADKYYDFNRNADGQLPDALAGVLATDDLGNHLYAGTLSDNPGLGIFSDGGVDTAPNGDIIAVTGSDFVRAPVLSNYIRDVRPELDPTQVHTVEGTPTSGADSHEVIVATDNADYIHARGGDDTVYGEGGDDFIYGDGGVDRLYGGAGNDMIDTGEGPDLADGGAGKDIIYGRGSGSEVGGFDQLVGGTGNDLIIGGEGIDKLSGGSGDDIIYGDGLTNPEMGNTDAFTHGGDGNDYIDTGASGDLLYGEEGDDYLVGGIDQDLIQGGAGDDIIRPGSPSQAINGGPDEVIGDDGYTNTGYDLVDFSDHVGNAPGLTIDFTTQNNPLPAIDGVTPFPAWFQMEGAIGSQNNDIFIGDSDGAPTAVVSQGSNWLIGGSGADTFTGAGANDIIIGGSVRLDALIGTFEDAANASGPGNLALGTTDWLADAMRTGSAGLGLDALGDPTLGPDGYDNDAESGYTGASNQAVGALMSNGLIDAANLAGGDFDKHFAEMLRSRMFKDVVLGDGGADTAIDVANFSGSFDQYTFEFISGGGINAVMVSDLVGSDGTDILAGIDRLNFTGAFNIDLAENGTGPLAVGSLTGLSIAGGADALLFTIGGTGNVEFLAAPNFELPADTDGDNVYEVQISGTATNGLSVTQAVLVTVTNADEPGTGALHISQSVAQTATAVTLNADAATLADPDVPGGLTLAYTWTRQAGDATPVTQTGGSVTINAGTLVSRYVLTAGYADGFPPDKLVTAVETAFIGTAAANTIIGTSGADMMFGLGGNDRLYGGAGNDSLYGGAGNDTYYVLNSGDQVFEANGQGSDDVQVSANWVLTAGQHIEYVHVNTVAGLTVTGNDFDNYLDGNAGNDTLEGGGGADILAGAAGTDTLDGGLGNDILDGGANADTALFAGSVLAAGFGFSGTSTFTLTTAAGGTDRLISIEAISFGGTVYNPILGTNGANAALNGTAANDLILGFNGNDHLDGGDGNDALIAGSGDDTITYTVLPAIALDDAITSGRDLVNGGANTAAGDTFVVEGNNRDENFEVWSAAAYLPGGIDANTEFVITRNGVLIAELDNIEEIVINGHGGTDTVDLHGNFSGSSLFQQTITVNGGSGNDRVDISDLSSSHRVVFNTGTGNDTLIGPVRAQDQVNHTYEGTAGSDRLAGGSGHDTFYGRGGNDAILAGRGNDTIDGGAGRDTYDASAIASAITVNLATGRTGGSAAGGDSLRSIENVLAGSGNDILVGDSLSNILRGGAGNDRIQGNAGADVIDGGAGNDTLTGGTQADLFQFAKGFGNDSITDFDANPAAGQDKIDLRALGLSAASFAGEVTIAQVGGDVLISIDTEGTIKLKGVDASTVTMSDFVLFG